MSSALYSFDRDLVQCGYLQEGSTAFLCQTIHHQTDGYPIIQQFACWHAAVIYGWYQYVTKPNRNIRETLLWSSPLDWKLLPHVNFFVIFGDMFHLYLCNYSMITLCCNFCHNRIPWSEDREKLFHEQQINEALQLS